MAESILTVVFSRWSELHGQLDHLKRGACFLPAPAPLPEPFAELTVVLQSPAGEAVELRGRVVQIAPGLGIAVACDDASDLGRRLQALCDRGAGKPDGASAAESRWGRVAEDKSPAGPEDEEPSGTLWDRVRAMSAAEKMDLALRGDRGARMILLKDPNKNLHTILLRNKGITADEVRLMAGNRQTSPDALREIGESREWTQNPQVVLALVTNPKTPAATAKKLLSRLPPAELRRIAKSPHTPDLVAAAARKLVTGG